MTTAPTDDSNENAARRTGYINFLHAVYVPIPGGSRGSGVDMISRLRNVLKRISGTAHLMMAVSLDKNFTI
jgi:hypothetical protein